MLTKLSSRFQTQILKVFALLKTSMKIGYGVLKTQMEIMSMAFSEKTTMSKNWLLLLLSFFMLGCASTRHSRGELTGMYECDQGERLLLRADGTYVLYNPEDPMFFDLAIEQCEQSSKGKWSTLSENLIEITSDNYYTKDKGCDYILERDNAYSSDSLYIQVVFPENFSPPARLTFSFNGGETVVSLPGNKPFITLSKSDYLYHNTIVFTITADLSWTPIYKGRVWYFIFNERINTSECNYLKITLPNFNRCYFEYVPQFHELIMVKKRNVLYWHGERWIKKE